MVPSLEVCFILISVEAPTPPLAYSWLNSTKFTKIYKTYEIYKTYLN